MDPSLKHICESIGILYLQQRQEIAALEEKIKQIKSQSEIQLSQAEEEIRRLKDGQR